MKVNSNIFFSLCCILVFVSSCYYDNEEDLYGVVTCDTADISYAIFVEPLISQNCYVCHSASANFGGVTLEGHAATKVYVDNGRLLGAIEHLDGFSPMPQGAPMLLDCSIEKLKSWVADGALDN